MGVPLGVHTRDVTVSPEVEAFTAHGNTIKCNCFQQTRLPDHTPVAVDEHGRYKKINRREANNKATQEQTHDFVRKRIVQVATERGEPGHNRKNSITIIEDVQDISGIDLKNSNKSLTAKNLRDIEMALALSLGGDFSSSKRRTTPGAHGTEPAKPFDPKEFESTSFDFTADFGDFGEFSAEADAGSVKEAESSSIVMSTSSDDEAGPATDKGGTSRKLAK